MPLIAFRFRRDVVVYFDVYDISEKLRHRGWLVQAYGLPENCENDHVLRIVVKEGLSMDLAHLLMDDLHRIFGRSENKVQRSNYGKSFMKHADYFMPV